MVFSGRKVREQAFKTLCGHATTVSRDVVAVHGRLRRLRLDYRPPLSRWNLVLLLGELHPLCATHDYSLHVH